MEFSEACSDVWCLLQSLKPSELSKIPKKLLETIRVLKIDDYNSKINLNIPLEEQDLSQTTIGLISFIYNNYLGTQEEKEQYEKTYKEYIESTKDSEKYKIEFKNRNEQIKQKERKNEIMISPNKDNIFLKILYKIKQFFNKK